MKELTGLIVFFLIAGVSIHLAVEKKITHALTALFLAFSLVSGWSIANYDWLSKLQWQVPGLDAFESYVEAVQNSAVEEICRESEAQKGAMLSALNEAREAHSAMDSGRESLEALIASVNKLEENLKEMENRARELSEKNGKMEAQLIKVHQASSELALVLTRVIWLQFEARDEYGVERARTALEKVMDGLDEIVNIVIVEPKKRQAFVDSVKGLLPPRQQE